MANMRPEQGDDDRPDYRVGHPAAHFADRLRHFSKERQVERRDPLGHHVEQHQRERNQRDDDAEPAEHDDEVGHGAPPVIPGHAALRAGAGASARRGRFCRPIDQMNIREMTLMISVMTKSTMPISTSACR